MENRGQIAWLSKEFWAKNQPNYEPHNCESVSKCQSSFDPLFVLLRVVAVHRHQIKGFRFHQRWPLHTWGQIHKKMRGFFFVVNVSLWFPTLWHIWTSGRRMMVVWPLLFVLVWFTWYHLCTFPVRIAYIHT